MSLEREVGEIHTKVNSILTMLESGKRDVEEIEDRVNKIEKWQHMIIGGFTAAGGAVGAVSTKIFDKLAGL